MQAKFVVKKVTKFKDLLDGKECEIPTSDLLVSNDEAIIQWEYVEPEYSQPTIVVKPGFFTIGKNAHGVLSLIKTQFVTGTLLETVDNTKRIQTEVDNFFSKLNLYESLELQKKRSLLLYSDPGMSKTVSIKKTCINTFDSDPGTVVLVWPTSEVSPEAMSSFLTFAAEYTEDCTKLILIIEDIGGGVHENHGHRDEVSSGLLNLLDGVNVSFKIPTMILATTNYPQNLLSALADRPGRFDQMIELHPPSDDEKVSLFEFFIKRPATEDEKNAFKAAGAERFSIAHIKEVAIRMLIHDKTASDVVNEMIEHKDKFNASFEKPSRRMGIF